MTSVGDRATAVALAIQPDGKILVAGKARLGAASSVLLLRYRPDGTLDSGFGTGGVVLASVGSGRSYATDVAIQSDGKIVVTGNARVRRVRGDKVWALLRFNGDGSPDTLFGTGGLVTTRIAPKGGLSRTLLIQPDQDLVVGGVSFFGHHHDYRQFRHLAAARYLPTGALDPSFGVGGRVVDPYQRNEVASELDAILLQPDGKIVGGGGFYKSKDNGLFGCACPWAMFRFNPDGSSDPSFGTGGKVYIGHGPDNDCCAATSIARQGGGGLVSAGYSNGNGVDTTFLLRRASTDGVWDDLFGQGGRAETDFHVQDAYDQYLVSYEQDQANAIVTRGDSSIIAAGCAGAGYSENFTTINDVGYFALASYLADGSPDTSFGTDGQTVTDFPSGNSCADDLAIQADGAIVVVGHAAGPAGPQVALARYEP